ncbi:MAG: Dps family protein [Bryobacteraceae bacterium]
MSTATTTNVNIGLAAEQIGGVLETLKRHLADTHVLYVKTRNYHWNVVGRDFQQLHQFFETQYTQLEASIDEIAERIRSLGGDAPGSMVEFLQLASLKEEPGRRRGGDVMLQQLLADHEAVIRSLRESVQRTDEQYGDAGTADFLTGLLEGHEKMAWMIRAHTES